MLHVVDFLIILVALASNEHDITSLSQLACRADRLTAVGNDQRAGTGIVGEAHLHLTQDLIGVLGTGVVAGENGAVAAQGSLTRHDGSLAGITVTAASTHGDDVAAGAHHLTNGVKHIDQGVGRVGIIDDGRVATRRTQGLETSSNRNEQAHLDKHLLRVKAQQDCSAIDRQQVIGIETASEHDLHLVAVQFQRGAVQA